jgi:hypothetical protein
MKGNRNRNRHHDELVGTDASLMQRLEALLDTVRLGCVAQHTLDTVPTPSGAVVWWPLVVPVQTRREPGETILVPLLVDRAPGLFPVGDTTVRWTAADTAGQFVVRVTRRRVTEQPAGDPRGWELVCVTTASAAANTETLRDTAAAGEHAWDQFGVLVNELIQYTSWRITPTNPAISRDDIHAAGVLTAIRLARRHLDLETRPPYGWAHHQSLGAPRDMGRTAHQTGYAIGPIVGLDVWKPAAGSDSFDLRSARAVVRARSLTVDGDVDPLNNDGAASSPSTPKPSRPDTAGYPVVDGPETVALRQRFVDAATTARSDFASTAKFLPTPILAAVDRLISQANPDSPLLTDRTRTAALRTLRPVVDPDEVCDDREVRCRIAALLLDPDGSVRPADQIIRMVQDRLGATGTLPLSA